MRLIGGKGSFDLILWTAILVAALTMGCSVRRFAINKLGDALASGGSTYTSDEDIELVGEALPFSLKLVESLLAESPRHKGLLLTACKGFTSYSYIYVKGKADVVAVDDVVEANQIRDRARKLFLRANRYCLQGLELSYPGIGEQLWSDPERAAAGIKKRKDVPFLYWTAASLGLAISVSKKDAAMLARLPEVEACIDRGLELDESWNRGDLHAFQVTLAGATGQASFDLIDKHFQKALQISNGGDAGLFVAYAEAVHIPKQNRAEFEASLQRALAVDPDLNKDVRLANLVAQRRARWLLGRVDDLILEEPADIGGDK